MICVSLIDGYVWICMDMLGYVDYITVIDGVVEMCEFPIHLGPFGPTSSCFSHL